jgi:hypothetical protein
MGYLLADFRKPLFGQGRFQTVDNDEVVAYSVHLGEFQSQAPTPPPILRISYPLKVGSPSLRVYLLFRFPEPASLFLIGALGPILVLESLPLGSALFLPAEPEQGALALPLRA